MHIKANDNSWATRARMNTSKLEVGMKVYVVETVYDMDTGEKLAKPRVRMAGTLREVWLEKEGKKVKKLFPS